MARRHRRSPGRRLPARRGTGPGPGGRGGPGDHPPLRGGRPRRGGAAGVRAGDPRRTPHAPGRHQGPPPCRRPSGAEAGAARVAAVAAVPPPGPAGRGPASAPGPPGPARSRQDRHRLGGAAAGRDCCPSATPAVCSTLPAGRRHNLRLRQWQIGRLLQSSPTRPPWPGSPCSWSTNAAPPRPAPPADRRVPKPRGRTMSCPHCAFSGHRDLAAAASIATRTPGGGSTTPAAVVLPEVVTHRRAGRHLPGAGRSRRDPRRPPPGGARIRWPAEARPTTRWGVARPQGEDPQHPPQTR